MKITEIVTEAPLTDYVPLGNFNKPGAFRSPVDKKLITHPVNQLKTAKFFEKTPYDFRLFFSNIPGTSRYKEYGVARPEVIQEVFKSHAEQIMQNSDDAITVVYVGNFGDARVMLTPWIMAHRLGHAIQTSQQDKSMNHVWRQAEQHFFKNINELLEQFYNVRSQSRFGVTPRDFKGDLSKEYNALFNAIGTQRSSREGLITRPYEFFYELFAQYLGTGKITLNPLPTHQDYGSKAWGRSTKSLKLRPDDEKTHTTLTEVLAYDMELLFNDVLSICVGKIFIM